jgi:hypothetical protein
MKKYNDPVLKVFNASNDPIKMQSSLKEVYANELKNRKREYKEYLEKVSIMKKHNFE